MMITFSVVLCQRRPVECCPRGPKLIQNVQLCSAPCCQNLKEMSTKSMPHMGEFIWCQNSEVCALHVARHLHRVLRFTIAGSIYAQTMRAWWTAK